MTAFKAASVIFSALLLLSAYAMPLSADEAVHKKKELRRIKQEIEQKKQEIKKADKKERSILSEIEAIDRAIQAGETELAKQIARLEETERSLKELQTGSADKLRELERLKDIYRQRVRALYKAGRSAYLTALIPVGSDGSVARKVKYLGIIAQMDRQVIKQYADALSSYQARQAEVIKKRDEIRRQSEAIAQRKKELEQKKRQKAGLLTAVRTEKLLYEQTLKELEESSASLWAAVKQAEEKKKSAAGHPGKPVAGPSHKTGRGLAWPAEGRIITPYGVQRHPQFGTVVFRRGIEIEARPGSEVKAAEDGVVAYADWQKGYGRLMIIRHAEGFYTLYGYLSRLDAGKDEQVRRGQVIGSVGDTGGAGGAKLYFEVRADGQVQDPLKWLVKSRVGP